jgi:hypothetical protein
VGSKDKGALSQLSSRQRKGREEERGRTEAFMVAS